LDDCWQYSRDAQGNIQADSQTFPSGIKALADYGMITKQIYTIISSHNTLDIISP